MANYVCPTCGGRFTASHFCTGNQKISIGDRTISTGNTYAWPLSTDAKDLSEKIVQGVLLEIHTVVSEEKWKKLVEFVESQLDAEKAELTNVS